MRRSENIELRVLKNSPAALLALGLGIPTFSTLEMCLELILGGGMYAL